VACEVLIENMNPKSVCLTPARYFPDQRKSENCARGGCLAALVRIKLSGFTYDDGDAGLIAAQ